MKYYLKGFMRETTVDENGIHIAWLHGPMKGTEKTIPFSQIASVVVKKPTFTAGGFIQFQQIGNTVQIKTPYQAANDENTVDFGQKGYDIALEIKAAVEGKLG